MTSTQQALIVIDMQEGFTHEAWGPTTNQPGCEDNVSRLVDAWNAAGAPIVVVRHDSPKAGSPLNPDSTGNALIPAVAAIEPSLFVTKSVNSAFYGTPGLEDWLRANDISRMVVCGIQTNMCVETTARMGGNLGFEVVVPLDATRTFDLTGPDGATVAAASLMQVTATNLHAGGFASVVSTDDAIAALGGS